MRLLHFGRREVELCIDLMEPQWDDLMVFDPAMYGGQSSVMQAPYDPAQQYNVRGKVPKITLKKELRHVQNYMSAELGFDSVYSMRSCEAYLASNSGNLDTPLKMYPVSMIRRLY